jgi:hypothetical protein
VFSFAEVSGLGTRALTHNLAFTGKGVLATAKIPCRRTTLVKNCYPMQITCFATRAFRQKRLFLCFFQNFYLEFFLQKL